VTYLTSFRTAVLASAIALVSAVVSAQGIAPEAGLPSNKVPGVLSKVAFEQHLNEQLPLELPFKDEMGRDVKLGDYFGKKPVVLTFVYYECPMLCTQVLNGLASALGVIDESIGKEFDVVTVSFDSRETPVLAAGKKQTYLDRYQRAGAERGISSPGSSRRSMR
jgi:protein SCO1/2